MKILSHELPEEDRPSVHAAIERAGFAVNEFSFQVGKREVEFLRKAGYHFITAVIVTRQGGWTTTYNLDEHLASRIEVDLRAGVFGGKDA